MGVFLIMQINGPSHIHGPQTVHAPHRISATRPEISLEPAVDQIDISPEAELVSRINDLPEVRADRIAEIRHQIEAGIYETDDKLNVAVGRLLDEIG
jgi:anti-sigma28 factor (negative regulator of flagellin synthesis)